METIVWWSAGGGKVEIKKLHGDDCLVERGGGKFKYRSFMEPIVCGQSDSKFAAKVIPPTPRA